MNATILTISLRQQTLTMISPIDPAIYRRIQHVWDDLTWDDFAQATACYYANCTMIDDQVGRIMATLDELHLAENTIVVFTSDHGDYMGEHRLAAERYSRL